MFTAPKLWQIPFIPEEIYAQQVPLIHSLRARLMEIADNFKQPKFSTSLAAEDMVITDLIAKHKLNIEIFTLDTAKLFAESLELIAEVEQKYHLSIQRFSPNQQQVSDFLKQKGPTAIYQSIAARRRCCYIRKIEPLNRALINADAWITGQRREQSITRQQLQLREDDPQHELVKFNPLFDWQELDVWAYVLSNQVPLNKLYLQGYPSIGCEPCTIAVRQGQDIRSGRWSWEKADNKECGLHH